MTRHLSPSRHDEGVANLVTVLITLVILSAIMLAIYGLTFVLKYQSSRFYNSQAAFFAAEGALYETVQRIDNPDNRWDEWPNLAPLDTLTDGYQIGDTRIDRVVTYVPVPTNPSALQFHIVIDAERRGARRRLTADYLPATASQTKRKHHPPAVIPGFFTYAESVP